LSSIQHIKVLPPSIAGKIAAGEVVQRPASVAKELVENSLDANANSITVIIENAGKTLIQVVDDGDGMSPEDAVLAFERHATSKISTYEDLENILTFGFRGEALASVAAVSQVEMRTRPVSAEVGTRIRIEGGVMIEIADDAMPKGTAISVKNLFYNTPARRNFLKSNPTEFKNLFDGVQRIALSHPEIGFKVVSDGETILNVRRSTLEERMKEIFGEKLARSVFFFEQEGEYASCSGFLGKPDFARKTRAEQYLFLNDRTIQSRSLGHAVYNAYENLLEKGSFPFFVLFLTIDPKKVDVNVHPSKMEVKFADDQGMYRFVMSSVRHALGSHNLIPDMGMREHSETGDNMRLQFFRKEELSNARPGDWRELLKGRSSGTADVGKDNFPERDRKDSDFTPRSKPSDSGQTKIAGFAGLDGAVRFWQVHNKYIVVPTSDGLMLVDQHAAHERVLYERAVERFDRTHSKTQNLLFPQTLELPPGDAALVKQMLPILEGLGFQLKVFGANTVIVDGIPIDVKPRDEETILQRILDLFKETGEGGEGDVKLEPRERLAKSYSCRAAIKAGDALSDPEIRSLLDQLFASKLPFVCPHGRPVIIKLSLSELDRRFGRTPT
jgi:DNA mismatch repair protein MutL